MELAWSPAAVDDLNAAASYSREVETSCCFRFARLPKMQSKRRCVSTPHSALRRWGAAPSSACRENRVSGVE